MASSWFGGVSISDIILLYRAGNSLRQIAKIVGVSHMTVYRALKPRIRLRPRIPR